MSPSGSTRFQRVLGGSRLVLQGNSRTASPNRKKEVLILASQEPISAAQLQAARSATWRQAGEPLLTREAAHDWLAPLGLVLFAPRAQQLGAPAPSLVEATLGARNDAPALAETETARSLLARLVAEGHAVPLNLLGGPGDVPDFLASAQVFSFVYTLRGDKLWKQPPPTSGTNKVTPLALSVYEMLAERGALTAAELASELGRELTESAIARALGELWQHMRVIPLLQQGTAATQWELTTRRFTKTIKAGTNAGQPTALSALVSLYLAQSLLASEEEVAGFLSPLAARSRIREVLHALVAARELNELVIDGKTLMHIPGALPEFAAIQPEPAEEGSADGATGAEETAATDGGERIKRFAPREGELDSSAFRGKSSAGPGFRSRPAGGGFRTASNAGDSRGSAGDSRGSDARRSSGPPRRAGAPPTDRERRPFRRDAAASAPPPRGEYAKPWDEDRKARSEQAMDATDAAAPANPDGAVESRPPRTDRPAGERPFRARPSGDFPARKPSGDRKSFGDRKPSGDRKPYGARPAGDRPARKPFGERSGRPDRGAQGGEDRPRRSFSASADRPPRAPRREGAEGERPFRPRAAPGAGDRPFRPRPSSEGADRPRRDAGERPGRGPGFSRGPGASRSPSTSRGPSGAGRPPREGGFRPMRREGAEGSAPRPPFRRREEGESSRPSRPPGRPSFGDRSRSGPPSGSRDTGEGRKPFSRPSPPAGAGDSERPRRPYVPRDGAARPPRPAGGSSFGERKRPAGDRDSRGAGDARKPYSRDSKPGGFASKPGAFAKRAPGGPSRAGFGAAKRPFGKGPAKGPAKGASRGPSRGPGASGDRPARRKPDTTE